MNELGTAGRKKKKEEEVEEEEVIYWRWTAGLGERCDGTWCLSSVCVRERTSAEHYTALYDMCSHGNPRL